MSKWKFPNNHIISIDQAFVTEDGTQYPKRWLRYASQNEKNALGLTEIISQQRPNDQYYWVTEHSDGTFSTTEKDINSFKPNLISRAWTEFETRFYGGTVTVQTSAGEYEFGCDKETIENINSINTMIARGLSVSNPRPYTPKGQTVSVNLTHDDFGLIGEALAMRKDILISEYLIHKATIMSLTQEDFETLMTYDVTQGWSG